MAKEEWRLCAEWLVRCKVLAPDHKVTWPQSEVFDLAQTLRDGVLICHLLNNLKPGAIDLKDFSQRPQMSQFLCLKNIRTFLQTCKNKFNLNEKADLFDSYDLFDMKDFGKVIRTLSKLSKCSEAAKSGISGFPPSNVTVNRNSGYYNTLEELATTSNFSPASGFGASEEEDLYRGLEIRASKVEIDDEPLYDYGTGDDDLEDIYGEIMYHSNRGRRPSTQVKAPSPPRPIVESFEPKTQRDYCVKELVETERNYVDALSMIITHFIRPLKQVIPAQEYATIFMGIEQLQTNHTGFLSELQKACSNPGSGNPTIADCFIKWKTKFLIYGEFCSNLPKAQDLVDELCKRNSIIQQQIIECQMKANDGKFRLRDLLSVPMQRVLKYHLLLQELKKKTEESHPDRKGLEKALEAMQDLSWYVNEVKRDNETLQLLQEIQDSIYDLKMPENTTLKDYGKLLKDGELKVKMHGESRAKNRYIFLFDKVMLMCKSRMVDKLIWGEAYTFKDAINLSQYKVDEAANMLKGNRDRTWSFHFLLVEKQNSMAYTFSAKTEDMRRKWIEAIMMALDNTHPPGARKGNHEFIMHNFNEPHTCDVCGKLLRGVFYQGYRCQICHKSTHKECIMKTRPCLQDDAPLLPPRTSNVPSPRTPVAPVRVQNRPVIGKCKAEYVYQGVPAPDDNRPVITFEVNDVIDLLSKDDEHWWEGRMNGYEGFFPAQYVKVHRLPRKPSYEQSQPQTLSATVPPPVANGNIASSPPGGNKPYVNLSDLSSFPWYVGEMSRDVAMLRLERHLNGTYLIRTSNNPSRRGEYALSIKFRSSVKHIKVNRTPDNMFYLADCKVFRSIPELVEFYQTNSLKNSFPELETTLQLAYKDAVRQMSSAMPPTGPMILGYCIANFDYAANQPNQLSLRRDDRIAIISKAGEDRGWWKGQLRGKTGYFPRAYVVEEGEENLLAPQFK